MVKGGYSLIDCTGLDLAELGTVTGLYNQLDAAIKAGKFILLANVENDGTSFTPIPSFGGYDDDGIFVSFEPVTIHVSTSDVITI